MRGGGINELQRVAGQKKKPKKTQKTEGFSEKPKKADTESDTESDTDTESDFKESTRESTPPPKKKYGEKRLAEQMGVSKRNDYIELRASSEK